MATSHEVSEPAGNPALATSCDGDSSSGFSDYSSDTDDPMFVDDTPTSPHWQMTYPAQYSLASTEGNLSPEEHLAFETLDIYREVVILDDAGRGRTELWIRLLRILPGTKGQPLRCKLIKRLLWDAGEYIALSYSWGNDQSHQEIYIENSTSVAYPFRVSTHLWNALQRLREERCVVNVWIDAICIDQQNYVERAAQVTIMAQIFNLASEVRVWLGEVDMDEQGESTDAELFLSLRQQHSPWWTRLWILQEFAYAKNCPTVMFGAHLMSFERLIERWHSVTLLNRELELQQRKVSTATFKLLRTPFDIWTAQKDYDHRRPLLQRLRETAGRKCSDPHDRIYALLSLINESEAKQLRPDYRKPYAELVLEVAEVLRQSPSWNERRDNPVFDVLHPDALVRTILSDVDTKDGNALQAASSSGLEKGVQMLIDAGANVNCQKWQGNTALHEAIKGRHENIVKLLIGAGANVNAPSRYHSSALHAASRYGLETSVRLLIDAGADVNALGGDYGSAMKEASKKGYEKIVKILIDAGADVNAQGELYGNALQEASWRGYEKIVKILIDAGADVNAQGGLFGNALQAASASGRNKIIEMLIEKGADVNARG